MKYLWFGLALIAGLGGAMYWSKSNEAGAALQGVVREIQRDAITPEMGGAFRASVRVSGLQGEFGKKSAEWAYYRTRWLPGRLEIADLEDSFPVAGKAPPPDPSDYALITGYQTAGTPVRIEVECTERPQLTSPIRDGTGWRYRVVDRQFEFLQFAWLAAPGLHSIAFENDDATFAWTPQSFGGPEVFGPKVIGVYVVFTVEKQRFVQGEVVETQTESFPHRLAWLFIGCPGDRVEQDDRMVEVRWPPEPTRPAAAPAAATTQSYAHRANAFRLQVPADWTLKENFRGVVADTEFDTFSNPGQTIRLIVGRIHESGAEPEQTFEVYTQEKLTTDKGSEASHFALGDVPAVRIAYPIQGGHVERVSFIRGDRRYVINAVLYGKPELKRMDPRIAEILATIEFPPTADDSLLGSAEEAAAAAETPSEIELEALVPDPLPDEAGALSAAQSAPTAENIAALARVRAQRGLQLLEMARANRSESHLLLAARYALSATELSPESAHYWLLLGHVYGENEDSPLAGRLAEQAAEQAHSLAPQDLEIRLFLAQMQLREGFLASALGHLEALVRSAPERLTPPLVGTMTITYLRDRQTARGRAFFSSLLDSDPQRLALRLALAILLHHDGEDGAARAELAKVQRAAEASAANRQYAAELGQMWDKETQP